MEFVCALLCLHPFTSLFEKLGLIVETLRTDGSRVLVA